MPKTNNPGEEVGEGTIETAFGRVSFQVTRGHHGFTIPRGTVLTFPDGSVMGTLAHEVKLNGFNPTRVRVSGDSKLFTFENQPAVSAGFAALLKAFPEIPTGGPPVAKSAIDRLLEDDDLV